MTLPRATLGWALETFPPGRLGVVSALGPGTLMLIHLLSDLGARVPIVFIDTLHHFPETLDLVERVRARYAADLRVIRPAESRDAFEAQHGTHLWERDLERYQQLTKVAPFQQAIRGFDAYITGRRRDQSTTRAHLEVVERGTPVRINPLAAWRGEHVWRFIRRHDVPYNVLHDQNYGSIGDAQLTTPTAPDEPERAGRWRGTGRLECGIHQQRAEGAWV